MSHGHLIRRSSHPRWATFARLGLALVALVAAGCAKKVTVDQLDQLPVAFPEGRRDSLERTPSDLVVWPDVPVMVLETWSNGDTIAYPAPRTGAGAMQGLIVDYAGASGYQLFRHEGPESAGGYRQFDDFTLTPSKRYADRNYYASPQGTVVLPPAQLFAFSDAVPTATSLKSYIGRAVLSGLTSASYPLTNLGETPDTTDIPPLLYTGKTQPISDPPNPNTPPDSLLALSWETIPRAAGYWVHIYQKRADIQFSEEAIAIAQPAPIALGKVRDLFVAYFPAPITAYKLGDPLPTGCRVLVYRVLQSLQEVLIRVSAVDARGRMIATTGSAGDRDEFQEKIGQIDRRREFPLGAKKVTPARPLPPP